MRLIDIMAEDDHTLQDVLQVVESDSVLTASVLKVVNSAAFGLMSEITSISRAVAYVGDKLVVGLAIGACAGDIYNDPLKGYSVETRGSLWRHSLKTAIASREIASYSIKKTSREIAYTAGILHDIGKAILSDFLGGLKPVLLETLDNQMEVDYLKVERNSIGIDHCEVGFELAKHWNLPEPLKQIIRNHHHPVEADEKYRDLAYVVHLGDMIAMIAGTGTGIDTMQYQIDNQYDDFVDVTSMEIEKLILDVDEQFNKTSEALSLE
jgi:putative nucleotidyltransferase with HDIG domain